MNSKNDRQYAAIEKHIRKAQVGRALVIADALSEFVVDCWNAVKAPPAAPAILPIDRRRESRANSARNSNRLSHR